MTRIAKSGETLKPCYHYYKRSHAYRNLQQQQQQQATSQDTLTTYVTRVQAIHNVKNTLRRHTRTLRDSVLANFCTSLRSCPKLLP
jgi:hypothetical protein